jgi:hypothetical protein
MDRNIEVIGSRNQSEYCGIIAGNTNASLEISFFGKGT